MSSKDFTCEDDEKLIEFVRRHEMLYNMACTDYRKSSTKKKLWDELGRIIGKPGTDCYKRWTYVRDYYVRSKGKPGEAAKRRLTLLKFLDDYLPSKSKRKSTTHPTDDGLNEEDDNNSSSFNTENENAPIYFDEELENNYKTESENPYENTSKDDKELKTNEKRRKLTRSDERMELLKEIAERLSAPANDLDETDLFFNSMAKIVKKLQRCEQIKVRMDIATLIGNAELRSISNEQMRSGHSTKWNC